MEYTVFIDQVNRRNFQVEASNEEQAQKKANRLYRKYFDQPTIYVQEGWIVESDGADK